MKINEERREKRKKVKNQSIQYWRKCRLDIQPDENENTARLDNEEERKYDMKEEMKIIGVMIFRGIIHWNRDINEINEKKKKSKERKMT